MARGLEGEFSDFIGEDDENFTTSINIRILKKINDFSRDFYLKSNYKH